MQPDERMKFSPLMGYDQSIRMAWLGPQDRIALDACQRGVRRLTANVQITPNRGGGCHIIRSGWAVKYVLLPDGRRQVIDILVPGDWFWTQAGSGYSVATLTPAEITAVGVAELGQARAHSPGIDRFLLFLAHAARLRRIERLVTLGQRNALERVSHLLWETCKRLDFVGYEFGHRVQLTRQTLADALGMTERHVARVLLQLRQNGLIQLERGTVHVVDLPALFGMAAGETFSIDEAMRLCGAGPKSGLLRFVYLM